MGISVIEVTSMDSSQRFRAIELATMKLNKWQAPVVENAKSPDGLRQFAVIRWYDGGSFNEKVARITEVRGSTVIVGDNSVLSDAAPAASPPPSRDKWWHMVKSLFD